MRVTKEKAAENRARILAAAARLFRERGLSGVGVDALGEAAGMTHGSLYSQFGSKERLAAEALAEALARGASKTALEDAAPGSGALSGFVARYLSARHRDEPGQGCALAALGCEIPRQPPAVRRAFTEGLQATVERLARLLPAGGRRRAREEEALAVMAALVGALVLARAVDDPALSERILAAARDRLAEDLPASV
jgi:TetR/AcrR family transcriptional regulator, transcriptional repressor for nem operon